NTDIGSFEIAAKDPLVTRSDDWDFPTNKLPNVGWLGRVHRGTPWQTVNLKSGNVNPYDPRSLDRWRRWTGNREWVTNFGQLDTRVLPLRTNAFSGYTNDAYLTGTLLYDGPMLDVFTTSFNDNASRGRMSVNQEGLAAWSAILSGVIVNSNANPNAWGV